MGYIDDKNFYIKLFIKQKIDKKVFFQICQSKAALSENEVKKMFNENVNSPTNIRVQR